MSAHSKESSRPLQLPLGIRLNDECRFENYHISEANQPLLDALLDESPPALLYIRSQPQQGLSHLLQALCHQQSLQQPEQGAAFYLPMRECLELGPELLEGVSQLGLLCIDDLQLIAGNPAWERALFNAFNDIHGSATRLVIGARDTASDLQLSLPDLQSRLQLAPLYQLHMLNDDDKKQLLQLRARARGMNLSPAVAAYILARTERSLKALVQVLDALDASSLAHQRPLTIPLVRDTMAW
jgi:DnaA family protein